MQKSKSFNCKSNFLYDGAKNRPPNLGFWTLAWAYFQYINAISQKNQLSASETEVKKDTKSAKIKKNLIVSQIFYMMEQKIDSPNLGFWTLALAYFQITNTIS